MKRMEVNNTRMQTYQVVPKKDNIHLSTARGDSYNVLDNFYITTRGMGKSAVFWSKLYNYWKNLGRSGIVLRTIQADITFSYLDDIETLLNKFRCTADYVKISYKKGSIKDGVVDVFIQEPGEKEKYLFVRVIALGIKVTRYKSLIIRNPSMVGYDEFLPNTRLQERYLPDAPWRVKELYSTFARECDGYVLKRYWFGNPYTRYIPYLLNYYKIDTLTLKPGDFIHGENYIIDLQKPKPELIELLKKQNPDLLNDIDEEWTRFMNGEFINDENYIIEPQEPQGYALRWVFRIANHYIGCFRTGNVEDWDGDFGCDWYVKMLADDWKSNKRDIYAVNFDNLVEGTKLITATDKTNTQILRNAIAQRRVAFKDVNSAYLLQSIYTLL